jgi:hypothetical protein
MVEIIDISNKKEHKPPPMPDWHMDVASYFGKLIPIMGHFFKIEGIDPNKPDIIFLRHIKPTAKTLKLAKLKETEDAK